MFALFDQSVKRKESERQESKKGRLKWLKIWKGYECYGFEKATSGVATGIRKKDGMILQKKKSPHFWV